MDEKKPRVPMVMIGGSYFFRVPEILRQTYGLKPEESHDWEITVIPGKDRVIFDRVEKEDAQDGIKKSN